ncbi:hypothetical protein, partial [Metapseudomonas otitidis]|uniref:hypothetical protein n=1 Tax=Metapseudomonas otitidis TaxID=319939 RepID=UPI00281260A9
MLQDRHGSWRLPGGRRTDEKNPHMRMKNIFICSESTRPSARMDQRPPIRQVLDLDRQQLRQGSEEGIR